MTERKRGRKNKITNVENFRLKPGSNEEETYKNRIIPQYHLNKRVKHNTLISRKVISSQNNKIETENFIKTSSYSTPLNT